MKAGAASRRVVRISRIGARANGSSSDAIRFTPDQLRSTAGARAYVVGGDCEATAIRPWHVPAVPTRLRDVARCNVGMYRCLGTVRRHATVATAPSRETEAPSSRLAARMLAEKLRAPAGDEKSYKVLELENGLHVILASDPNADTAAAAMTVKAGTFQDPDHRPGLAHFHEHMLFLGTQKYPKEDEYNRFLGEHGGDSNAYTMGEYTTYYFKVAAPNFTGALDRFAEFFVSPTFDPSCVEREMRAVDSESTNYSTEDSWRLLQVLRRTASPGHPFHRFDIGNLETLGATDPQATRAELIEWNREHYRAGAMRLALVGREDLSDLEQLAVELFGRVPPGVGRLVANQSTPWPAERTGRIFRCVPVKEARALSVCWQLPPQADYLFAKPELYFAHVLGHEGPGSLHDVLNQRGWIDQLTAGPLHSFADGQLFAVSMGLTPEGDAHRDDVISTVFEYVALLQHEGPREDIFHEIAALQEIAFAYKEDAPAPDDFAVSVAGALHHYPPSEALRGPLAVDEWLPDVLKEQFCTMTPERSLIFATSPSFEAQTCDPGWHRERWYGAWFHEERISEEQLQRWSGAPATVERARALGLTLPEPNQFVPRSFALLSDAAQARDAGKRDMSRLPMLVSPPTPLHSSAALRLWHKPDHAFRTPRAVVLARIHTPAYDAGPAAVVSMRLLCGVVLDDLNTLAYDATVAGLTHGLDFSDGLSITVGGFNDRLPELLALVAGRVVDIIQEAELDPSDADNETKLRAQELMERLEVQRHVLLQDYSNLVREEPWSICSYYVSQLMVKGCWHLADYIEELEKAPPISAVASAVREAFKLVQTEVFVQGNATAEDARSLTGVVSDMLSALGSQTLASIPQRSITQLPAGAETIFEYNVAVENPAQENSCTQNIYQVGPVGEDWYRDACLDFICHVAATSAYQQLRTEEQLGYIVQASAWAEQHVAGFSVLVQGNRLAPHAVDARIEAWLVLFGQELAAMSRQEFDNNIRAVVSGRTQRYANLQQEAARHWVEILSRRYQFDRLPKSVEALESLSQEAVMTFFNTYLAAGGAARKKLSARVLGASGKPAPADKLGNGCVLRSLQDIREFRERCMVFEPPPSADMPAPRQCA